MEKIDGSASTDADKEGGIEMVMASLGSDAQAVDGGGAIACFKCALQEVCVGGTGMDPDEDYHLPLATTMTATAATIPTTTKTAGMALMETSHLTVQDELAREDELAKQSKDDLIREVQVSGSQPGSGVYQMLKSLR